MRWGWGAAYLVPFYTTENCRMNSIVIRVDCYCTCLANQVLHEHEGVCEGGLRMRSGNHKIHSPQHQISNKWSNVWSSLELWSRRHQAACTIRYGIPHTLDFNYYFAFCQLKMEVKYKMVVILLVLCFWIHFSSAQESRYEEEYRNLYFGPYRHIYPPVDIRQNFSNCTPNPPDVICPIFFSAVFGFGMGGSFSAKEVVPAVQLALDQMNNDTYFLRGYKLHYLLGDSNVRCSIFNVWKLLNAWRACKIAS